MRAAADHRKENAGFHPGCREGARTRRKIRESWRTRFPFRFSNPAAQNVFHDPVRRIWSSSSFGSSRRINSDKPSGDLYVGGGVAVGDADSAGELVASADAASCGSTFVKYGELFACVYQSGAASSFFKSVPRGSTLQNSRTLFGSSRVKRIVSPSGEKIGPQSCPELSFVSWRKSFPSSLYE